MGSSHQSSSPTSDSAVFGYQAKLLSRNGGSSSKMSPSMEFGGLSASRSTTPMASKRNSIDVGSIRGQWAQREAEERKLFVELGGTPQNTIPRPKGPLSSNSSTSPAFSSFSSRAGSPSTSRPMSPEVLSTRNTSTTGNDSLQRLLHRRAKSYVPPSKALAGSDVEKRIAAEPSDASDVGRTASTATYGSERTFSSSTTASMNPLVADFTGSSNASSIVGPNGERRFKSSYMARKDAKKRGSAMSMVDEDSTLTSMISASGGEYDGLPQAIAIQPEDGNDLAAQIKKKLESESIQEQLESNAESRKQESIDKTMAKLLGSTPTKQIRNETKPSSPDEDLSPTVKAFRDRLKNEGPLYRPDMSPSTSLRKKMSTSLLGEPYWPNPNPVGGSNRTPAWKPSDQSVSSESPSKRQSPLASSFDLEFANPERVSSRQSRRNITPVKSKSAFKSVVVPPVGSSGIYGETRRPSSQNDTPGKRYGSIGKTDGRKLGKHLPRIASGDQFEEDWQATQAKYGKTAETKDGLLTTSSPLRPAQSESRIANTTRESTLVKTNISSKVQEAAKGLNIDRKSPLEDQSPASEVPVSPRRPELGSKRFSMPVTPQKLAPDGLGMQGLVGKSFATPKASPGLVGAGSSLQRSGSVAGVKGRIRLSKLPASSTSASLAPAPLPSKRLNTNWMDRQRKELIAYEYLCHVGEAQQWIEGCLEEELGYGVVEMEECMTDGVALAKLARKYQGEDVVRQIWEDKKHRFRQSDNIVHFLNFARSIGLPETFIFETTDLYNKKNIPKVIYCIHVLSHLLARLGMADKIGNLVGQFDFSDEQLAVAQQGLQGLAMPNFNSVGNALAKECNIEPEEDAETEEEVRDRLLLECETEIIQLQALLRGFRQRQETSRITNHLQLAEQSVLRFQSRARGVLSRRAIAAELESRHNLDDWAINLQAQVRGTTCRQRWHKQRSIIEAQIPSIVLTQATLRGWLVRKRQKQAAEALRHMTPVYVAFQAALRGHSSRLRKVQLQQSTAQSGTVSGIIGLQAVLRSTLAQRKRQEEEDIISSHFDLCSISLQAQIRGVLLRKKLRVQVQTLDDSEAHVIALQAVARGVLARRRRLRFERSFDRVQPTVVSLQSLARAKLARRTHQDMQKALSKVEMTSSIGGLQSLLRSRLASKKTLEQKKQLEFVQPDVIGFQALARGVLARRDYNEWLEYLQDEETQAGITFCQQLLRGHLARQRYWSRLNWYHYNVHQVVKVQAIWRGRKQRSQYRKIVSGQDVDVPAIQSFMHLLDDSETDFAEEIQVERLRKKVIENIHTNQSLESQVTELDTKIALILQNRLTFEDLVKVKGLVGNLPAQQEEQSFSLANSDPFSHSATLERASRRKLELYQHLFFLIQTQPKYLARLIRIQTAHDADEQGRRLLQGVVLALYSYGQSRREEYLLLKLLQLAIHEHVLTMESAQSLIDSRLVVTDIALAFIRPKHGGELKTILGKTIGEILKQQDLDLCIDPVEIYHRILNDEESESGVISTKPRDVDAHFAVTQDPVSGQAFFQQLAQLQLQTDAVLAALYAGTKHIPYTIRCMAREMLLALQVKTQYQVEDADLIPVIARGLILPYILPGITAPESQGVVSSLVGALPRQNITEIANLITAIATGRYRVVTHDAQLFGTLENYIDIAVPAFCDWVLEVASVDDVETQLQTQELVEVSVAPKPITMTRAEIYAIHATLQREVDVIAKSQADPLRPILGELGGVPNVLYQEGQTAPVTFSLTNRFAKVTNDPMAVTKADWVQAKRHILATLRVQTGKTLIDILTAPVTDQEEFIWEDVVERDVARERIRKHKSSLPPVPNGSDYTLEDIRSLPFREVKARAIQYCMKLEKEGMLSRATSWQDLLDDIAGDIRTQNKNRQRRKKDHAAMDEAMVYTSDKKRTLEDQILSYNKYITSAMDTMQKQGKKRFVWPLSKQARHLRSMQKAGKAAKFGSYRYSAVELYEKHVLLPSEQTSPRQFEKLSVILSSNEIGVFMLDIVTPTNQVVGSCEVKMEDLLQAKFENKVTLDMFDQVARVRVNTLIFLINKKFYA